MKIPMLYVIVLVLNFCACSTCINYNCIYKIDINAFPYLEQTCSMDVKIISRYLLNETINFLNSSIEIPCFGDTINCPDEKVLKSYYKLPDQTCNDGKTAYCNQVYCRGRNSNAMCCIAKQLVESLKETLTSTSTRAYDTITTSDYPSTVVSTPSDNIFIIVALVISVVLLLLIICYLAVKLLEKKKELSKCQSQDSTIQRVSTECGDSGIINGSSELSSLQSKQGFGGLATSNGSLNKKKIHGNPVHHDTGVKPAGKDKKHQYCIGTTTDNKYHVIPRDDNDGDGDPVHCTKVLEE